MMNWFNLNFTTFLKFIRNFYKLYIKLARFGEIMSIEKCIKLRLEKPVDKKPISMLENDELNPSVFYEETLSLYLKLASELKNLIPDSDIKNLNEGNGIYTTFYKNGSMLVESRFNQDAILCREINPEWFIELSVFGSCGEELASLLQKNYQQLVKYNL